METKKFSDFGIKPLNKNFIGDKIKIPNILDKEIKVIDYKIVDSKHKTGEQCLHLQLELKDEKRVTFSGSKYLIEMAKQITKEQMPFITTIKKQDNGSLIFS